MAAIEKGLPLEIKKKKKTRTKKDVDLRLRVLNKLGRSIPRVK